MLYQRINENLMYLLLCVYWKHFVVFSSIIGRIQVIIYQKYQRWLHVFLILNIVTTVLNVVWKFYRDMEMIEIFIDDNV